MPGVYKEKECPTCGVTHRKRGPYCGRSCAGKANKPSPNAAKATSEANKKRWENEEYAEDQRLILADAALKSKGKSHEPIPPQFANEYLDSGEVIDGDYWTSDSDW